MSPVSFICLPWQKNKQPSKNSNKRIAVFSPMHSNIVFLSLLTLSCRPIYLSIRGLDYLHA